MSSHRLKYFLLKMGTDGFDHERELYVLRPGKLFTPHPTPRPRSPSLFKCLSGNNGAAENCPAH